MENEHVQVLKITHVDVVGERGPHRQSVGHQNKHEVATRHEVIQNVAAGVDDLSFLED